MNAQTGVRSTSVTTPVERLKRVMGEHECTRDKEKAGESVLSSVTDGTDNTRELVVKSILGQTHKCSILFDEQNKFSIRFDVCDFVYQSRDSFATHTHFCAVDQIAIF